MVRSIKLVGVAFVAVLALGAVMASAASATALIHFTKEGAFEGKGGEAHLETLGASTVNCKTTATKGLVLSEDKAHIKIEFLTCTGTASSVCTTTEGGVEVGTKGNINVLALALLGSDKEPPLLDLPAVLILTENSSLATAPVTFKCGTGALGSELTVRGSVVGLVLNVQSATKCEIIIHFNKAAGTHGMQEDFKFWDESHSNSFDLLESEAKGIINFGFEDSSEEAEATLTSGANKILIAEPF